MQPIILPKENGWGASIQKTFNVDLESIPGSITVSRYLQKTADTGEADMAGLGIIDNFLRTNADGTDRWWGLNRDGKLCRTDSSTPDSWSEDTLTGSPDCGMDMAVHENDSDSALGENLLLVTRDTGISSLNDTANNAWKTSWGLDSGELDSGIHHPIEYFPMRRISIVGNKNFVHTIDKSKTITSKRLTLPPYLQIEHIITTAYRIWILCSGKLGMNGAVVEWDGSSETYNHVYDIQSSFPLTGVNYYEVPIILNNRGLLLEFNGSGFYPMVRNGRQVVFPSYSELGNGFLTSTIPAVSRRGMTVTDDGLIHINVGQPGNRSFSQEAGIWCINPLTGDFYNKYTLSSNGDSDYGQQGLTTPGAIKSVNIPSLIANSIYMIAGGRITTDEVSGAQSNMIWKINRANNSTIRRGYFITKPFLINDIQEMWDIIWSKFSSFRTANSKIIIKAKGVRSLYDTNKLPLSGTATWTSTTTFTITLNASDEAIAVGDEIEVRRGKNAGSLAHITEITGNHAALQTITIDDAVKDGSGGSSIKFDRWKKLGVIDNQTKYFAPLNIGIHSTFVQFKVELRGSNIDFDLSSLTTILENQVKNKK